MAKKIFVQRLNEIMDRCGMTNRELAEELFITEKAVSGYRTGYRQPDLERLTQICCAIPVSADYLLGLSEYPYLK